jgi:hypothetical protein
MTGIHTNIRKRISSYRIVSRRPRQSEDALNDHEQTAAVRVPSPVTLVPLDKLHEALPVQQTMEDLHLTGDNALHVTGDILVDTQEPSGMVSEQVGVVEEDDEDTQKTGAIKVSRQESTRQEALSTAAPDDLYHQSGVQSSKLLGVVILVTRILMVIIIGLFFLVFTRVVLPKSTIHAAPQLPAGVAATATVAVVTPTPSPIPALTITPDHFNATIGCTFAQGRYKCIITLTLSKDYHNKLKWSVSRSGLTATFSPSKGRLRPGHQQQIVLYVYNNCPHSGLLIFSVAGKTITIPWSC